jgi:hypothetical protein
MGSPPALSAETFQTKGYQIVSVADRLPAIPNGVHIDHAIDLHLFATFRNPPACAIRLLFGLS